jgi:RimJ/RimL family protein N-acetyltransferase
VINAIVDIKLLAPEEWHVLRTIRLRALHDSSAAFMSYRATEARWSEAQWRRRFASAVWVVAIESGTVIGVVGIVDGLASNGRHIERTWVEPTHRRRGGCRALLEALIDMESRNGAQDIALWVLENNHVARAAYVRLGFRPTGPPSAHSRRPIRVEATARDRTAWLTACPPD